MSRALLVLDTDFQRQKAVDWCWSLKDGTRVEFKAPKRTDSQNDKMWAMLTEVSVQLKWHGIKLTPDDWKLQFLDALRRAHGDQIRVVPNTDNTGFVNLGTSSSDLSKEEMSDLIELIFKFGAEHGVEFHDPHEPQSAAPSAEAAAQPPAQTPGAAAPIPGDEPGSTEAGEQSLSDQKIEDRPQSSPASDLTDARECIDKLLGVVTDKALSKQEAASILGESADHWLGRLDANRKDFVTQVYQTAKKVLKDELTADKARQYLDSIVGEA